MGEIIETVLSWFGISIPSTESTSTSSSSSDGDLPGHRTGGGTH